MSLDIFIVFDSESSSKLITPGHIPFRFSFPFLLFLAYAFLCSLHSTVDPLLPSVIFTVLPRLPLLVRDLLEIPALRAASSLG